MEEEEEKWGDMGGKGKGAWEEKGVGVGGGVACGGK